MSHPISLYKFYIDTNFVVPVAILAASVCIFSRPSFSYCVQLSQISLPYSKIGQIKEVSIISNDFLYSWNLSFRIMFILFQAFFFYISYMCVPASVIAEV